MGQDGGEAKIASGLAPHLRRSFQTFPHSWSPDDCEPCASVSIAATCRGHDLEAALRAAVTTEASVAVVGRAAFRCPRAHVVQDKRAARVHVFVSRFAGTMQPTDRTEIASSASHVFPAGTSRLRIQIQASHHRPFMLAACSASSMLSFASTGPTAGPSGIDDTSARHMSGSYAMVIRVPIIRNGCSNGLDEGIARAYVGVIASVLHSLRSPQRPTERASGRRPRGTTSSAILTASQFCARRPRMVGLHAYELRTSWPLAAHHPQDQAPRRGCVHRRHCVALV